MKTWIAIIAVVAQIICLCGSGSARPFTRIVSPVQDQCVPGPDVVVKFEAGGMTLGPSAWNLHFKLDEEPFQVQYDGNHAHVFKNVPPGTHTVRMYAANAMHEAIPGTQSTVSFSVAYPDKANYVIPGQPTLTYNLPQGEYVGIDAADITVDFLVENAMLSPGGYQVAYYVDGRRFLVQEHCGPRHIKNLNPGFHRVRIELQNSFGDIVPGPFNSTERVILVSPDQVVKSPTPLHDGYDGLPRIDSIKGSMTMGQHWSATEPVRSLAPAEIQKQERLTVVRPGGETVGLVDGKPLTGGPAEVDQAATVRQSSVTGEIEEQFQVRPGGEREVDATNLDAVDTQNIRRGSIIVNEPDEVGDEESGAVTDPDEDAETNDDLQVEAVLPSDTEVEAVVPTTTEEPMSTPTARRRADGTTTTVRQTTETRRLADRPGMRQADTATTRTVRGEEPRTTPTRTNDKARDEESEVRVNRDREERRASPDDRRTTTPRPSLD